MNAKDKLIDVLQNEIDNADFTSEQSQDDSYQRVINKITEIFKECDDDSSDLHVIVETVNILDDLDLALKDAYKHAIISLIIG